MIHPADRLLEFDKVRVLIQQQCHSEPGRDFAGAIECSIDPEEIFRRQRFQAEAIEWTGRHGSFRFEGLTPLASLLVEYPHQTYGFDEFKQIDACLRIADQFFALDADEEVFPNLLECFQRIHTFADLTARFSEIYTPEGDVKDDASPELMRIRSHKRSMRKKIHSTLESEINRAGHLVRDHVITQRDNRFVIPVLEGAGGVLGGIVHGRSRSGSSVFLEPAAVVGLNNELSGLDEDEREEIFRIQKAFTLAVQSRADEILENEEFLCFLDFLFASARLALHTGATVPKIINEQRVSLIEARHPLLIGNLGSIDAVIPFDFELGGEKRVLVLSGPNTGGKTVTLKAVGLITLMATAGLPVPVREDSEIGIFTRVFADIGDHQSLESALSTFSSHLARLRDMVHEGDERSLILIDEIGSATDPEQGSALAQAIMEHLADLGSLCLVTTHYTAVKLFAEDHPACLNAAMHFDPKTLRPTYRFHPGLPGNSFAIEVAAQLGLDEAIIDRAQQLAGKQSIELTAILQKLNEQKAGLARSKYEYDLKTSLMQRRIDELEEKEKQLDEEMKEIRKNASRQARDYLTGLQRELNEELDTLKKAKSQDRKQKIIETQHKITRTMNEISGELREQPAFKPVKKPQPGMRVWLVDYEEFGQIIEISRDQVKVDIGGITFMTKPSRLLDPGQEKKPPSIKVATPATPAFSTEVKLLGMTFEESRPLIDELLDNAARYGVGKVRIVHGKGSGALRGKVRSYLRKHPVVGDFYAPPPDAGGDGVTVVEITQDS